MQFEPKTAIAFRSEEERIVLIRVLKKQGIRSTDILKNMRKGRAYICPENYRRPGQEVTLEQVDDPDDFACDSSDPFKWTYLEASDVLRNLIIAERRKHAT